MNRLRRVLLAGTALLAIASGCSNQPAQAGPTVGIVLDQQYGSADEMAAEAGEILDETAAAGGTVRIWISTSSNASTLVEVALSEDAAGGDFSPTAKNDVGRELDAAEWAESATEQVRQSMLNGQAANGDGSDVVGMINLASQALAQSSGQSELHVLTGGGVQRSDQVDLLDPDVTAATAEARAESVELSPASGVNVRVSGAGHFPNLTPTPDADFTRGVASFWATVCRDRCEVRSL